ncbi:unnamed protein product, partial [Ilex paraguariensis]
VPTTWPSVHFSYEHDKNHSCLWLYVIQAIGATGLSYDIGGTLGTVLLLVLIDSVK